MNEQRLRHLLCALAEEMAPDDIDLYPVLRTRIAAPPEGIGRARLKKPAGQWPSVPFQGRALVHTLVACIGVLVATFTLLLHAHQASIASVGGTTSVVLVSLDEAQRRVPFAIHRPTWVPDGLTLAGVFLATPPGTEGADAPPSVVLSYRAPDASPSLSLRLSAGPPEASATAPAALEQLVELNDQTAIYVHGAWQHDGTWDGLADASTLVWTMQRDNVGCVLTQAGLGLGPGEMARIAESLQ
jgi:hypothetical protein